MAGDWIKVYRKYDQCAAIGNDWGMAGAWLAILSLASRRRTTYMGKVIEAGEFAFTYRELQDSWSKSPTRIKQVFEHFQSHAMIEVRRAGKFSICRVVNYNDYQTSVTRSVTEKASSNRRKSLSDDPRSVTDPVTESVTNPVTESVTDPVTEMASSVTDPVTESVADKNSSVTKSVTDPVTEVGSYLFLEQERTRTFASAKGAPKSQNQKTADSKTAKSKPPKTRPEEVPIPTELDSEEFRAARDDWIAQRRKRKLSLRPDYVTRQYARLMPLGPQRAAACLRHTVDQDYQGLFPEKFSHSGGSDAASRRGRTTSGTRPSKRYTGPDG